MGLTARGVKATNINDGWHCDGHGLYLQVTNGGKGRSWVFRYALAGRQHYVGLGSAHAIGLARAREMAQKCRELLVQNIDPLEHRRRERDAVIAKQARSKTFRQVAEDYLAQHLDTFRNAQHRSQWVNTLAQDVYPKIGAMVVADITPADVLRVIDPIWQEKRVTAERILQRIARIMDFAKARQYRTGDNPANITEALPQNGHKKKHLASLPYKELPAFMVELRNHQSLVALALEFTTLTCARSGEVFKATWSEFNFKDKVWTVPATHTKTEVEHTVPLGDRALKILNSIPRGADTDRPFKLPPMAMVRFLQKMRPGLTTHGMRATFKTWAEECTGFKTHVIEKSMGHAIGDAVERAYHRGELLELRCRLMTAWEKFCAEPMTSEGVVPLRAKA
jgi:integrase